MININEIKMVQVCDVVNNRVSVWTYHTSLIHFTRGYEDSLPTAIEEIAAIGEHVEAITLMGNTARTNVMIRDAKGKFISYRNAQTEIKNAVESLNPFPTPRSL